MTTPAIETAPAPAPAPVVAAAAPAPTPAPAPVAPSVDFAAEYAKQVKQISDMEKDLHKVKEANKAKEVQLTAAKQALAAAGFEIAGAGSDPNAIRERQLAEESARKEAAIASREAGYKVESAFLRGLISEGVAASDRQTKAALAIAIEEGLIKVEDGQVVGTKEAIQALVKDGLLGAAKGPAAAGPSPQPARPAAAAAPIDSKFASVVSFKSLVALGWEAQKEFTALYPERARMLRAQHEQALLKPGMRVTAPIPKV